MNRRQNVRISHPPNQREAILQVARKKFRGYLLDESAGGFCFWVEGVPSAGAGQVGRLKYGDLQSNVRVVWVRQEEQGTRIGLERLFERPRNQPRHRVRQQAGNWYQRRDRNFSIMLQFVLATMLCLLVVPPALRWLARAPAARYGHGRLDRAARAWLRDKMDELLDGFDDEWQADGDAPRQQRQAAGDEQGRPSSGQPPPGNKQPQASSRKPSSASQGTERSAPAAEEPEEMRPPSQESSDENPDEGIPTRDAPRRGASGR